MKNTNEISQHLFVRVSGWRRFSFCNFVCRMAALVALFQFLMLGAVGTQAADLNTMTKPSLTAEVDARNFLKPSQGYLVETQSGEILEAQNSQTAYNPASAVKVLTAYATLKKLGPDFRFETTVFLSGTTAGTVFTGDVFIESNDPFFNIEYLKEIVSAFKEKGIHQINAALIVNPEFSFAGLPCGQASANAVERLLSKGKTIISNVGKLTVKGSPKGKSKGRAKSTRRVRQSSAPLLPGVNFRISNAEVKTPSIAGVELKSKRSQTVLALLKDMLSRSDNQMAATFGASLGGPQAVARTCRADFNLTESELSIATTSGLGVNRVTPKAMIAALKGFKALLASFQLDLSHALPVAGVDYGTIYRRFLTSDLSGVMVGKTGTLKETDKGACVLVGEMSTLLRGKVFFVVFQHGRNTSYLRGVQNKLLKDLLVESGGPGAKYGV